MKHLTYLVASRMCVYTCGLLMYGPALQSALMGTIALDTSCLQPLIERLDTLSTKVAHLGERSDVPGGWLVALGLASTVALTSGLATRRMVSHESDRDIVTWTPRWRLPRWWRAIRRVPPDYEAIAQSVVISPEVLHHAYRILWLYQVPCHQQVRFPVVLISGPPGTGKTTLAHTLAHASGVRYATLHAGALVRLPPDRAAHVLWCLGRDIIASDPAILIIDDADLILASRQSPGVYGHLVYYFLQALEILPAHATILLLVNNPQTLDPAIRDRVSISITMPPLELSDRRRLIDIALARARADRLNIAPAALALLYAVLGDSSITISGRQIMATVQQWLYRYQAIGQAACQPEMIVGCIPSV